MAVVDGAGERRTWRPGWREGLVVLAAVGAFIVWSQWNDQYHAPPGEVPGGEGKGAPNPHPTCPACGAPVGEGHYWKDPFYWAERVLPLR